MVVGFRNKPATGSSTIDWSYLNPPTYDYDSVAEVGDTNTVLPMTGGDSDSSGNTGLPGSNINRYSGIPRLTFANPDKQDVFRQLRENSRDVSRLSTPQIPANLDFGNTIYDVDSGNFVPHEYPKIPSILGTEAVNNTLLYGRPSGAGHLSPTQVSNIHNAAAKSQAYNAAARDALWDSGASTQHYTHTDKDGNRFLIDPVEELASINQHGWDMKGNYMPLSDRDPIAAYWEHKAAQDAIANYGAHSGTGGVGGGTVPVIDAITNGINLGGPDTSANNVINAGVAASGHDVTNTGQGFDFSGHNSPGHPANNPASGGK